MIEKVGKPSVLTDRRWREGPGDIGVMMLRVAVGLLLVGAALATLAPGTVTLPVPEPGQPPGAIWMPQDEPLATAISVIFLGSGAALILGTWAIEASVVAGFGLVAVALRHLVANPFFNLSNHVLPALALVVATLLAAAVTDRLGLGRFGLRRAWSPGAANSAAVLLLRLFSGVLFVMQGITGATGPGGIQGFARAVYVEPFASGPLPTPILWLAGLLNPPTMLLAGLALLLGLRTRLAAIVSGLFLVSIVFGHMLEDALDTVADMHHYSLANFAVVMAILFLVGRGDRFSIDGWRRRRESFDRAPEPGPG